MLWTDGRRAVVPVQRVAFRLPKLHHRQMIQHRSWYDSQKTGRASMAFVDQIEGRLQMAPRLKLRSAISIGKRGRQPTLGGQLSSRLALDAGG